MYPYTRRSFALNKLIIRTLFHSDYVDNQEIIRLENEKMELTQRERELAEQLEEDRLEIFTFIIVTVFIVYFHPLTNTFGIANIISVILSSSSSFSSFLRKNHPYMGNCLIGYYQDQTHGYDQGQEGGGIELKTIE